MAFDLNNSELLLPSDQFFTLQHHHGDGLSMANSSSKKNPMINQNEYYLFGSSDFGSSELSSPIGSELSSSSTTTTSSELEEDDDYFGELTRQMAQNMLQDEDDHGKPWGLSGSPESTLWSLPGLNLDCPAGPIPSLKPMIGKFETMRINEETARYNQGERSTSTSTLIQASGRNQNFGFQSKQALIDDQIRAIQFYRFKQEQAMKQMKQKPRIKNHRSKGRVFGGFNSGQKLPLNSNNPCYNLQQQSNQAVFFNQSGSGNGSLGTGVFLPRGIVTPCESRKKQGCATVLIPAGVLQALKLHFEKTGALSRFNNGFPLEHDA